MPRFFGDAFSIFLLRQFFLTIPEELSDAARVDGASEFQIMTRVIVPLAKPAIAAVALFHVPLLLERLLRAAALPGQEPEAVDADDRSDGVPPSATAPSGTSRWRRRVLFMLPVIVLFFLAQRVFVEGVTLTGVKG